MRVLQPVLAVLSALILASTGVTAQNVEGQTDLAAIEVACTEVSGPGVPDVSVDGDCVVDTVFDPVIGALDTAERLATWAKCIAQGTNPHLCMSALVAVDPALAQKAALIEVACTEISGPGVPDVHVDGDCVVDAVFDPIIDLITLAGDAAELAKCILKGDGYLCFCQSTLDCPYLDLDGTALQAALVEVACTEVSGPGVPDVHVDGDCVVDTVFDPLIAVIDDAEALVILAECIAHGEAGCLCPVLFMECVEDDVAFLAAASAQVDCVTVSGPGVPDVDVDGDCLVDAVFDPVINLITLAGEAAELAKCIAKGNSGDCLCAAGIVCPPVEATASAAATTDASLIAILCVEVSGPGVPDVSVDGDCLVDTVFDPLIDLITLSGDLAEWAKCIANGGGSACYCEYLKICPIRAE